MLSSAAQTEAFLAARQPPPFRDGANLAEDPEGDRRLAGLRMLIVEDEAVVSMLVEQMLEDFGCKVVALAARVQAGVAALDGVQIDAAVLDMNLAGEAVDPVVDALTARGIPFVFATGYGERGAQPDWADRPLVTKPFQANELRTALLTALQRRHEA